MLFSSHFYTRLTAAGAVNGEVGWENVKGWTKKKPPLDLEGVRELFASFMRLFGHELAIVPAARSGVAPFESIFGDPR